MLTALTDPTETAPSRKQNKQKQKPRAVHIRCVVYIWATVDHVNNHSCRIQFSKSDDIKSTENFQTQSQISASYCDLFYMLDRHILWGLVPLKTTIFNKVHKELQLPLSLTQNCWAQNMEWGKNQSQVYEYSLLCEAFPEIHAYNTSLMELSENGSSFLTMNLTTAALVIFICLSFSSHIWPSYLKWCFFGVKGDWKGGGGDNMFFNGEQLKI